MELSKEKLDEIRADAEKFDGHAFTAEMYYKAGATAEALKSLSIEKERDELKAWKESAIAVMPDYQAIGTALNVKLGATVHDKILPGINDLKAERDRYKEALEKIKAMERKDRGYLFIIMSMKEIARDALRPLTPIEHRI